MPQSVHNGQAGWHDCGRMFPDKLRVSTFLDRFPHYAWTAARSAHSDLVGSRVYACLGVTCHLHFVQNDLNLLRATAVTRGWNGHRWRVSTQSWLWRREFSRRSCQDSNSQPFDHESDALPAPWLRMWTVLITANMRCDQKYWSNGNTSISFARTCSKWQHFLEVLRVDSDEILQAPEPNGKCTLVFFFGGLFSALNSPFGGVFDTRKPPLSCFVRTGMVRGRDCAVGGASLGSSSFKILC